MNTEQFIREAARKNWSRRMTAEALGMSRYKFYTVLSAMEPLDWPAQGYSVGNQQARRESRGRCTPRQKAAITKAARVRAERAQHTHRGFTGSLADLTEKFGKVGARTVYRRIAQGWSLEDALTTEATPLQFRRASKTTRRKETV